MAKLFKFGEKKHYKRKIRMRLYNLNKVLTKKNTNDGPGNSGVDNGHNGVDTSEGIHVDNVQDEGCEDITATTDQNENNILDATDGTDEGNDIDLASERDDLDSSGEEDEEIEIEGKRLVDMNAFLKHIKKVSEHNKGNCAFSELQVINEVRVGIYSKLVFGCKSCKRCFRVRLNEDEKTASTIGVNSTAVLGANMVGIGYTQLEQLTSVLNLPIMSNETYKILNDKIGELWMKTAQHCMREAAKEEALAAIARGDVDEDGIPFITVVCDGCWSKRSYRKNFTALSGVAAIVGAHTEKVLWIGVRNKYCVTCVRNENKQVIPPPHFCTKNFTGPSSEMEWEAILEGFKSSVELYNLRFMKIIADGDSSTYPKLLENRPYGDRHIEKIECTNHLLRNFVKSIEDSTKGCPRGLKNKVTINLGRIRKDVCCAVQFRKNENTNEDEKVSMLKSDLDNILHHVFGDHTNCPQYIKKFCKDEEDLVPALKGCTTFEKMSSVVRHLMYCAKDLILGETNNVAEHYNSIVAKFVGGKRVNFSLSNAYGYKANAAAVSFNTKTPLSSFYSTNFGTNPPALTKKIEMKRVRKCANDKIRRRTMKENKIIRIPFCRNKQSGSGYGIHCEKVDLSPENLENEKRIIKEKLDKNQKNRISIEENTRLKQQCSLWYDTIANMILSKDFGPICKARIFSSHVKKVSNPKFAESKSMKHHNESQSFAQKQLASEQNMHIQDCGLYIDVDQMFLAASPTGIVKDCDMIVDIRCPLAITNMDPNDPKVLEKLDFIEMKDGQVIGLKKSHNIYFDIQGQLYICNQSICLFSIWTSSHHKMYVEKIKRDDNFFNTKMRGQLQTFYNDWLLPELADSRSARTMPTRES